MLRKYISVLVVFVVLSTSAFFTATPVLAAAITVTSKLDTADPGKCRLRDAITAANTNTATGNCPAGSAGIDTISFSLGTQCNLIPCTITLTSTLPTVTEDLIINGSAATISGGNAFPVFILSNKTVNISNLKIATGNTSGPGGAIYMVGSTLTVTNVFFSGNHALNGGAIYEANGTLTVVNSNFSGNSAGDSGGAINNQGGGLYVSDSVFNNNSAVNAGGAIEMNHITIITNSTFSGNSSAGTGGGGAIDNIHDNVLTIGNSIFDNNSSANSGGAIVTWGTTDISLSTFSNNKANGTGALGGALLFAGTGTTLTISESAFLNNISAFNGGAIFIAAINGFNNLKNVTMSGNSAKNDGGGIAFILPTTVAANLNNVTITNNTADSDVNGDGDGGGISSSGNTEVQNSIIAGNFDKSDTTGHGLIYPDCSGNFSSFGYNLIGTNQGCIGFTDGVSGDIVGSPASPIDPRLGVLAKNGGATVNHMPLPGSPALNAGDPLPPGSGGLACAAIDQRSVARPQGTACDIGAVEYRLGDVPIVYLPVILR